MFAGVCRTTFNASEPSGSSHSPRVRRSRLAFAVHLVALCLVLGSGCVPAPPSIVQSVMTDGGVDCGAGPDAGRVCQSPPTVTTELGSRPAVQRKVGLVSPPALAKRRIYGEVALRTVCLLLGIFMLVVVFFDEAKEKGAQDKLVALWIRLDDREGRTISRHATFVRRTAALMSVAFDRVFGQRLVSVRAVLVSTMLSMATICAVAWGVLSLLFWIGGSAVVSDALRKYPCVSPKILVATGYVISWVMGLVALVVGVGAVLPMALRDGLLLLWEVAALVFLAWWLPMLGSTVGAPMISVIALGLLFDLLFVMAMRWLLQRMHSWTRATFGWLVSLGMLGLSVVMVLLPAIVGISVFQRSRRVGMVLMVVAATNVYDSLVAGAYFAIGLAYVFHRLAWPMIKAPLYAVQRHKLVTDHKKVLFVGALSLLSVGVFGFPSWLQSLVMKIL